MEKSTSAAGNNSNHNNKIASIPGGENQFILCILRSSYNPTVANKYTTIVNGSLPIIKSGINKISAITPVRIRCFIYDTSP